MCSVSYTTSLEPILHTLAYVCLSILCTVFTSFLCILVVLMYDTDIFPAQCQFPFTAVETQNYTACTVKVNPQSFMLANVQFI